MNSARSSSLRRRSTNLSVSIFVKAFVPIPVVSGLGSSATASERSGGKTSIVAKRKRLQPPRRSLDGPTTAVYLLAAHKPPDASAAARAASFPRGFGSQHQPSEENDEKDN